jgi:hypothetical protein
MVAYFLFDATLKGIYRHRGGLYIGFLAAGKNGYRQHMARSSTLV